MEGKQDLLQKVEGLPRSPGVYLMKDREGRVVYVGKAKDLRTRVRSYFRSWGDSRLQVPALVSAMADVDFIATDTEKEALILENNLIKQHRPRYNVDFRDDKDYLSLRLDLRDPFPRLTIVRRPKRDGCLYLGPYSSSQALRETLRFIYRNFPIRSCKDTIFRSRTRPCIYYQMHRCVGPCAPETTRVTQEDYRLLVDQVIFFLQGRKEDLIRLLKEKMEEESERLNFEEAGRIYRRIQAIEQTIEQQKIVSYQLGDLDAFGFYREGEEVGVQQLRIQDGKVLGGRFDPFSRQVALDSEVLVSYLLQYYGSGESIPPQVLVPFPLEEAEALAEVLSESRGKRVEILFPQRGEKRRLVLLACKNAQLAFRGRRFSRGLGHAPVDGSKEEGVLDELQRKLGLRNRPNRIECFDISNLGGQQAVGSLVRFEEGKPHTAGYRRYQIKTLDQPNDYGMMAEVLSRRCRRGLEDEDLPDLIMVDGGKGQLNIVRDILKELGIEGPDLIGIAKARKETGRPSKQIDDIPGDSKGKGKEEERIYRVGRKNPVRFPSNSPALHLLQRIRDEAHRFAITYHQQLRQREAFRSPLDDIPGIGRHRKQILLKHLGSLQALQEATLSELEAVPGLGKGLARRIHLFFHPPTP